MALSASQDVFLGAGTDAAGDGLRAIYPTIGANEISPELDRIICEALRREAKRIAFRLRLSLLVLDVRYFIIQQRYMLLRALRYSLRLIDKVLPNRRHRRPL